eukprot:g315.t1
MAWAIKSPKHEVSRGLGVQIEPPDVHHPLITSFFFFTLVPRDPFVRETRKRTFTQVFTQAKFPAIAPRTSRRVQLASAKYGYRRDPIARTHCQTTRHPCIVSSVGRTVGTGPRCNCTREMSRDDEPSPPSSPVTLSELGVIDEGSDAEEGPEQQVSGGKAKLVLTEKADLDKID